MDVAVLGGEHHKTGQGGDTRERYQRLEEWARANFDIQSIEFRWSTQDNSTVDGVPFIGRLGAGSDRTYVATGFRGRGMTNSHAAAPLLTGLIAF